MLSNENRFRNRLINEIPWYHILRERISLVIYLDDDKLDENGHRILGECSGGNKEDEAAILMLYRQSNDWDENYRRQRLRHTVYHEIAHSIYFRLRNSERINWETLADPTKPEFSIFQTNPPLDPPEEFAECFAHYIQEPEQLIWNHELKYNFLRTHVFGCQRIPTEKLREDLLT